MDEIKLFLFILSLMFICKNIIVFSVKLFETDPEPMTLTITEKILLYLSFSYVITSIILTL